MSQTISQRRALAAAQAALNKGIRTPDPFASKVRFFLIAVSGSAAFVGLAAAVAYCCITYGI